MRKHLISKTLAKVTALEDANVFGKVGTSADEIMKALTGKKVVDARQQGKYFWSVLFPNLVGSLRYLVFFVFHASTA